MNIPQAFAAVPSSLRAQVAPDAYAGRVLMDGPLLEALTALIEGPIVTRDDVERCELAIRAIVLHTGCSAIEPPADESLVAILEPFDPSLPISGNDPAIPESLWQELNTAADMPSVCVNAAAAHAMKHGLARPLTGAQRLEPSLRKGGLILHAGGGAMEIDVPLMASVMTESVQRVQRAVRLIAASIGGAGVYWGSEEEPAERVIADTLRVLDQWFDPLAGAELDHPRAFLVLPLFLAVVLNRASRRDKILEAIITLRGELAPSVQDLHDKLSALRTVKSQAEALKIARDLARYPERIAQLTKSDLSTPQWMRNVGPDALSGLLSLTAGTHLALLSAAVAGIKVLSSSAAGVPRLNYDVRPSLADRLHREARKVRLADHREVLAKHLSSPEMAALFSH
ncbi:hypothetical protein WME99_44615 [Sorangium sp. So ce136]|uniref:hypothetical protein n=1 Tax=Sorangium sp. So ce136 TaxID=3133284 RepID=UPI003EFDDD93